MKPWLCLLLVAGFSSCASMIQTTLGESPESLRGLSREEVHARLGPPLHIELPSENYAWRTEYHLVTGAWTDEPKGRAYREFVRDHADEFEDELLLDVLMVPFSLIDKLKSRSGDSVLGLRYDATGRVCDTFILDRNRRVLIESSSRKDRPTITRYTDLATIWKEAAGER